LQQLKFQLRFFPCGGESIDRIGCEDPGAAAAGEEQKRSSASGNFETT